MVASKSPRAAAQAGLKRLSADRADKNGNLAEIYHWGLWVGEEREPSQDRPTAIAAAAVVEHALEYAILTKMHRRGSDIKDKLFEGNGAILRDFSSKIVMAHALGILGDQSRSDVSMIRHIRNTFAHCRHRIDFDTPEIAEACRQLTLMRRLVEREQADPYEHVREEYIQTCFEFSLWLFTIDEPRHPDSAPHPPRMQLQL